MIELKSPLVSVQWLHDNLQASNLIVLDASMHKVTDAAKDIEKLQIPGARFFDIKQKFSDVSGKFPNTVPSEEQFTEQARELGINDDSTIIVYDDKGIYSSARAWYLFKAFGFNNVAVLDGGLPEWKSKGFTLENKSVVNSYKKGNFRASLNSKFFKFFDDMKRVISNNSCQILDARSSNRFHGLVDEPRAGLRAGHIPNSTNIPFTKLMKGSCLKPKEELQVLFGNLNVTDKQLVLSCGSGITACIIALAAQVSGYDNISVYDGSWTEYGTLT